MMEGPPALSAGEAFAPGYEVVAHLHRSNNFDVYDVWSEERACRCIAKAVCPDLLDDRRTRRGLIREGRLLARLTHPHIVRAYETIEQPNPALILETLTGATLAYLIDNGRRRLPLSDIIHLGLHLCSAIHYLHRRAILHLDLKPSNIISERQLAKVLDLSVARPPGKGVKGVGTANYMSPEQARGDALGPAADVWGIGAVLFEAAAGEEPFDAYDDETRYEQLERRAESIRSHRRVTPAFAAAVDACLEPVPAERPTVKDLMKILNELAQPRSS
jgi:serine/threonine protein kinase